MKYNAKQLRENVSTMTKAEFIEARDYLEDNWQDSLRPLMQILAMGCYNRFKVTLVNL